MATAQFIGCGPEEAIFVVAMTQMAKHYGFPVYVNAGITDSKRPDAQAGLEIGATLICAAAAGADIFGHMGMSGVDQGSSLDILLLQHEAISYVEAAMVEMDFSDEILGVEEIASVIDESATFLDRDHTLAHFRKELWFPKLLDRSHYQSWLDHGATTMEERCQSYREELLRTHEPEPIAPDLARALDEVVQAAKRELTPVSA